MPRINQVAALPHKKKFPGAGHRLNGHPKHKKMKRVTLKPAPLLKPTPMGRIISQMVKREGSSPRLYGGIDWAKHPRSTRSTCEPLVNRKTTHSVVALSREAERMLGSYLSSANDATTHAGRSTLMVSDMHLVDSIRSKLL